MTARHFICGDAKALAREPLLELSWEESVIARNENPRRHRRRGVEGAPRREDRTRLARFAFRPSRVDHRCGTSWKKSVSGSNGASPSRPSCTFCRRFASPWPVFRHHSPGVSPGLGIMALTSTSSATTSSHTRGAVKPASDCATRTSSAGHDRQSRGRPRRHTPGGRPYHRPPAGRRDGLMPTRFGIATTRCQYHALPPALGMRTNVKLGIGLNLSDSRPIHPPGGATLKAFSSRQLGATPAPDNAFGWPWRPEDMNANTDGAQPGTSGD